MESLLETVAAVVPLALVPFLLAGASALLLALAWVVLRRLTRERRQGELKAQIATLASQVTAMGRQVATQAPLAKATIQALRQSMESRDKLKEEEQLLDDLVVRARVLATATNADAHADAIKGLNLAELKQLLQALQVDARRMRGIWDTLEATAWVLRRSEEAIRRNAQNRRRPESAAAHNAAAARANG